MNVNWITHLENLLDKKRSRGRSRERSDHAKAIKTERKAHNHSSHQECSSAPLSKQHVEGDHLGSTPECDYQQLHAYRIEKAIIENYKKEQIKELYPWQVECLSQLKTVRWEEGESFLFVAPTSGGKTLVAEIFAFEQMDKTEKTFFLFPLNSLINEKMSYLKKLCRGTNIKVGSELAENDIVLCTYEKMNNYLNRNKLEREEEGMDVGVGINAGTGMGMNAGAGMGINAGAGMNAGMGVGCWPPQGSSANPGGHACHNFIVVIDEFHLISEKGRGIYIENIISKIMFLNKKQAKIKIICMSGTLNNFPTLKKWMNAKIYISPYTRPQEIKEHYICNCGVYRKEKEGCPFSYLCNVYDFYRSCSDRHGEEGARRCLYNATSVNTLKKCNLSEEINIFHENTKNNITQFLKMRNPSVNNSLVHSLLCFSVHSRVNNLNTLIFCSTKKNCEVYVSLINQYLSAFPVGDTSEEVKLRRDKLNESIRQLDGYAHSTMSKLVSNGICYYYSDITNSVKRLIEVAYKEKTLFLLTCTSTLSVGLNLLVDRVLISSPFIAQNFLSVTQYRQMIGRAARQKKGDSFLLVEKKHEKKMLQIFQENCTNITSTMSDGGSLEEMEKYLIEFLCLMDAQPVSVRDVVAMLSFSLCFAEVALSGGALSGEALSGEALSRESLSRASLSRASLSRASLSRASLSRASLSRASLSRASLSRESLSRESLSRESLSRESLSRTPPPQREPPRCPLEVDEENFTPSERIFYEAKKEQIHAVLNVLIQHKCVQVESNRRTLRLTNFCRSLCVSNFTVSIGSELLSEVRSYDKLYLFNYSFHLCYICSAHNLNIASFSYYLPFLKNLIAMICSDNYTKHVIFHVLKFDSDIINMLSLRNQNNCFWKKKKRFFSDDKVERKHNKLYLSILLFLYLKGTTCSVLCSLFKITEDVFQSVLQHTYMHVHILISFFDRLDEWIISSLLRKFLLNFKSCRVSSEDAGRAKGSRGRRAIHAGRFRWGKRKNDAGEGFKMSGPFERFKMSGPFERFGRAV
ncbi:DNA-directed DNA polymerase [Plasmodium cynomolgi strain B]|uniref:DNA-directed DNA polymerase n=1 Tax=Plasmodium cynomolgi (strain B) TaxID=1120755 RepID=K6UEJ4_PLACD|nr:DNA-directed DNA polymerase [Plasmodium cynomolgi strain B]GAB68456.1 DNA-directed DNA polymerase [Plasmodium cynomolgi strain B]